MEFTATTPAAQTHYVVFPELDALESDLTQVEVLEQDNHVVVKALVVGTGLALVAAWHSKPGRGLRNRIANAIKAD